MAVPTMGVNGAIPTRPSACIDRTAAATSTPSRSAPAAEIGGFSAQAEIVIVLVTMASFATPLLSTASIAAGQQQPARDPCAAVSCGPHGVCTPEEDTAYCFCDEGYVSLGRSCTRAPISRLAPITRVADLGARIVALAEGEDGRDLANVGRWRQGMEPGPLSRYVAPDGLWCSDFVSWVYHAAGVPLTGGESGGWLVRTNASIRRWFVRRRAWVGRSDEGWSSVTPSPGDYVRISTRTWGHSAIVRRIEGDTLFLIEGNASGRVRLIRYLRFRQHERIEGFGLIRLAHGISASASVRRAR